MTVKELFKKIAEAKYIPPRPPLAEGEHLLVLEGVTILTSVYAGSVITADFLADVPRQWSWFPMSPGYSGLYQQAAAKRFFTAVLPSVGATLDDFVADEVGTLALFRGVLVHAHVRQVRDKQGVARTSSRGVPIMEVTWTTVDAQPAEVLERAATACEAAALSLVDTSPERASAYMNAFQWLLHAPVAGNHQT